MRFNKTVLATILALTSSLGHAAVEPAKLLAPGKVYVGIYGGIASPNNISVNQYGTAFYTEAQGGPLAVNAFGSANGSNVMFIGGKIGFQWAEVMLNPNSGCGIAPALELEGFSVDENTFNGHLMNNSVRLAEHDFDVDYPTRMGVYLANAVVNFNSPRLGRFHPYVGAGFGAAVSRITGATAIQIAPPEVGLNHYNENTTDSAATFAGQAKAGLSFDLSQNFSVFAEYRWLYIASTSYLFGSTVYPGHPETSSWQVKMDPQQYNMGSIGVQFSV